MFDGERRNCSLGGLRQLYGASRISLGNRVRMEDDIVLYAVGKYGDRDYSGRIVIGDDVYINYNSNISSAGNVVIGNDVTISPNVFICNYDHDISKPLKNYLHTPLMVKGDIRIEEGAWIGNNSMVLGGVVIGHHSIVGAGSLVTRDVPPYCLAVGNPASVIKRYSTKTNTWERVTE